MSYSTEDQKRISDAVLAYETARKGDGLGRTSRQPVFSGYLLVCIVSADIGPGADGDAVVQYQEVDRTISIHNEHDTSTVAADKKVFVGWVGNKYRIISVLC